MWKAFKHFLNEVFGNVAGSTSSFWETVLVPCMLDKFFRRHPNVDQFREEFKASGLAVGSEELRTKLREIFPSLLLRTLELSGITLSEDSILV